MTPETHNKKLALVIVNFNSWSDLKECLPCVYSSDYKNFETVIIDNASTDNSAANISQYFPQATLLINEVNTGCGSGNNRGMQYALDNGFDYVLLLNSDTKIHPDTFSKLIEAAESDPHVGMVTPILNFYHSPDKIQYCGSLMDRKNFVIHHFNKISDLERTDPREIWIWGTMSLIKAEVLRKAGLYNEIYFVYCEDNEFALRVQSHGYKQIVLKNHTAYHKSHAVDIAGKKALPLYYFFYITRNEYFLWHKNLKGSARLRFKIHYLSKVLESVGHCKEDGMTDAMNVYLDALYCAWRKIYGKWQPENTAFQMPALTKKFLLSHPFLWAEILNGKIFQTIRNAFLPKKAIHSTAGDR